MSDLHGVLPEPVECDVALIAGDLCPDGTWMRQLGFLQGPFSQWLEKWPRVIFIAGNHDILFESNPGMIPRFPLNARYLEDNAFHPTRAMSGWSCNPPFDDRDRKFSVFGTPWSLPYGDYAFMGPETRIALALSHWERAGTNIWLSHGPPQGYGDTVPGKGHCGSMSLTTTIDIAQPKLVVCGHIHEGRGVYQRGPTTIVNASCWNRDPPIEVEIDRQGNVTHI